MALQTPGAANTRCKFENCGNRTFAMLMSWQDLLLIALLFRHFSSAYAYKTRIFRMAAIRAPTGNVNALYAQFLQTDCSIAACFTVNYNSHSYWQFN
jgi:hypothetical protein